MKTFPFKQPMLLDGATGTNLFAAGMPKGVSVEQWVLEHPDIVRKLQSDFIAAGSDAIYAPTFSANEVKLAHFGLAERCGEINRELVSLSKSVSGKALIGGDISSTGLFCRPFGDLPYSELIELYRRQCAALKEAGVDYIAAETLMSLSEARAALIAAKETGLPVFVTVTVDTNGRTLSGATALSCLICLQAMGAAAFGLNCSTGPEDMVAPIWAIAPYAQIPLIAKPNAGLPGPDGSFSLSPGDMANLSRPLLESGVTVLGGCCGSTPAHIAALRKLMDSFDFAAVHIEKKSAAMALCNETRVFFLNDHPTLSEPIPCTEDFADDVLDLDDDFDLLALEIKDIVAAEHLALNQHLLSKPVLLVSDDESALELALISYIGRAAVSRECGIEPSRLELLAEKYGAVLL